jgi:hypothetical protein
MTRLEAARGAQRLQLRYFELLQAGDVLAARRALARRLGVHLLLLTRCARP